MGEKIQGRREGQTGWCGSGSWTECSRQGSSVISHHEAEPPATASLVGPKRLSLSLLFPFLGFFFPSKDRVKSKLHLEISWVNHTVSDHRLKDEEWA